MRRNLIVVISYLCTIAAHYSAVMRTDKMMIIGGTLKRFRNFNYELDLKERRNRGEGLVDLVGSGDYVMIKSEDFKELQFKASHYDHVKSIMEETEETQSEFVQSQGKKRQLRKDILDAVEGKKACEKCHKNFKITGSYQKHIDSKHRGIYNYICKVCNKGFVNKTGYKMHKLTHRTESDKERIAKETVFKSDKEQTYVCKDKSHKKNVFFSSKRAFKTHMKGHTNPQKLYCYGKDTGCPKFLQARAT